MERRLGSLRLDARKLDHLRPLRHLGRDEGLTFSRGQRHRRDTEVRKPRLQCRLGQSSNHFLIERVDDLDGQMLWCAKSLPSAASNPGMNSPKVGTSGSAFTRATVETAKARNVPALMYPRQDWIGSNAT